MGFLNKFFEFTKINGKLHTLDSYLTYIETNLTRTIIIESRAAAVEVKDMIIRYLNTFTTNNKGYKEREEKFRYLEAQRLLHNIKSCFV